MEEAFFLHYDYSFSNVISAMSHPNINSLRAFDAAARHLNISSAARELDVTPGAISQQIKNLENGLEVKLFERHRRGLHLTEAGAQLHDPIGRAISLISEGIDILKSNSARISIAIPPSLATRWLAPRLASFAEEHPEIALQVISVDAPNRTRFDFALHLGAPPSDTGQEVERLSPSPLVAVTGPSLIARAPVIARPSFFRQYTLIEDADRHWSKWFAQAHETPASPPLEMTQTALALDAAEAGQGIAMAPLVMCRDAIAAGRLVVVKDFAPSPDLGVYLIRPTGMPGSRARHDVEAWIRRSV